MDIKAVRDFFDSMADSWDDDMIKDQWKIDKILDIAGVTKKKRVLDIACGTGVLIPDYMARRVAGCTAVDISEKMLEKAKNKFCKYKNIEFLCADAQQYEFSDKFDCIVIYNAFPHFVNPTHLFENLSRCLKTEGWITVAHGMGIEELKKHHSGRAEKVSAALPEADRLGEIMEAYFKIDTKISTEEIYIVSGTKR